ncbi:MAG: hypothetical protein C4303_03920, partial [candidate division GAL15 bacterium]
PAYIAQLERLVDLEALRQADLTIVVDPMWGNGAGWLRRLLSPGRIRVVEIHEERNPLFPGMKRPEPIPPNLDALQEKVRALRADAGLATDGDADRVGLVDENGEFVDQLRVYGLLALYLLEEDPADVQASGQAFLRPGVHDVAFLTLFFPSGRVAHLHVSWLDPRKRRRRAGASPSAGICRSAMGFWPPSTCWI